MERCSTSWLATDLIGNTPCIDHFREVLITPAGMVWGLKSQGGGLLYNLFIVHVTISLSEPQFLWSKKMLITLPGSGRSPGGEMATHSSILAWEISWTVEPGGLPSMRSQRVGHDWVSEPTRGCFEDNMSQPMKKMFVNRPVPGCGLLQLGSGQAGARSRGDRSPAAVITAHGPSSTLDARPHPQLSSALPSPLHEQDRMLQGHTEAGLTPSSSFADTGSWEVTVQLCASVIPSAKWALKS